MKTLTIMETAWRWFASAAGIIVIATTLAYGIMSAFTAEGPVVEVLKGPPRGSIYVRYLGTISYKVTTRRNESCPGTVRVEYRRVGPIADGTDAHVVSTFYPVTATEIAQERTTLVERMLPESVYPGRWLYRSTINSRCPLREQNDVLAEFEILVVPTGGRVE